MNPLGSQIALVSTKGVLELDCSTDISGLGETANLRDITSLVDKNKVEETSSVEYGNIEVAVNLKSLKLAEHLMQEQRANTKFRVFLQVGQGDLIETLEQEEALEGNIISFDAQITAVSLGSISVGEGVTCSLSLKVQSSLEFINAEGNPWANSKPWIDNYWGGVIPVSMRILGAKND